MTASVQETYLKAHSKIDTFRGESSLKTWVFSIASNLARDLLKSKKRWPENVTDICKDAALGNKQFFQEAMQGTVEHWARSSKNPIGGWYGLKKGFRGRFAMYIPP